MIDEMCIKLYCGHFMTYVSQIIVLYNLNLYSAVCQLCLSKTGRKKISKKSCQILATKRLKTTFLFLFTYSSSEPTIRRLHFTCQFWGVIWGKHWNLTMNFSIFQMMYTIFGGGGEHWLLKTGRQSRFDAWGRALRAGAPGWPWGMGWGGRWERGFRMGNTCTPMANSCQCMAKTTIILASN